MNQDLEERLDKIENFKKTKKGIYKDLIEIHENKKLRKIAGPYSFEVASNKITDYLRYEESGLTLYTASYRSDKNSNFTFSVEDEKLIVTYLDNKQELLEIFPQIEVTDVEESLIAGLEKIDLYKRAMEE